MKKLFILLAFLSTPAFAQYYNPQPMPIYQNNYKSVYTPPMINYNQQMQQIQQQQQQGMLINTLQRQQFQQQMQSNQIQPMKIWNQPKNY